jgi:hypothetical protein
MVRIPPSRSLKGGTTVTDTADNQNSTEDRTLDEVRKSAFAHERERDAQVLEGVMGDTRALRRVQRSTLPMNDRVLPNKTKSVDTIKLAGSWN